MKDREIFSGLRVAPPIFVRVDGRGFGKAISNLGFKKPYDEDFAAAMVDSTIVFFKQSGFDPIFAYLFSDEVSFYFTHLPFNGRVEKIDSIIPSFFASTLTIRLELSAPVSFDSRIIPVAPTQVADYLKCRQDEAWNNHVISYGYYTLLKHGFSPRDTVDKLNHMKHCDIHELTFQNGVNLGETPLWQRRGLMVYRSPLVEELQVTDLEHPEIAVDDESPTKNMHHRAHRALVDDWGLPLFKTEEGRDLIEHLIEPDYSL
ncbi:tRNA 5'-guanylyltransferase [Methanosarcinales archaeon ex4572_44]|nr:MAG: tRNA 5'-guanylyltransferase [Methanosarcinales archaeon ex4484_138]PHP45785.1 MAG: tRNA 5'-guanylyltransferase [Methanosarcinales archaeon ex4572_44]RLG26798.1 MAG: tRNA 5'-guanylyltransferase [Methanosarcinales archaeon]